jgi:hypothetical protein
MFRFDDDAIHKHAAATAKSAEKITILAKSETAHDSHLADNFTIADSEWQNCNCQ